MIFKCYVTPHLLCSGLMAVAILAAGCGHPQASPLNRPLIASLRTAVSTQNPEWLERNASIIDERHAAGELSEEERDAFQTIIGLARDGQWEEAEQRLIALQKAQRPTAAEVQQVELSEG